MKKINKLLSDLRDFLPVSRREMKKVVANMVSAMDGFMTTSITQCQVYTGLIKEVNKLKNESMKAKTEKKTNKNDVKGYQ